MHQIPQPDYRDRRHRLRSLIGEGWLLLFQGPEYFNENLYYLTGLDAFYTVALISLESDHEFVITNPLQFSSIKNIGAIPDMHSCQPHDLVPQLAGFLAAHRVSRLYLDYSFHSRTPLPPDLVDYLRRTFPTLALHPLPAVLSRMRLHKEPCEIATIRQGIEVVRRIFALLPNIIRPGLAEAELAAEIYRQLVQHGFNKFYDIMVASGSNSAIPIYRANQDLLPDQGVVLIDICAAFHYYVCDLTQTFPVSGRFTERQEELFSVVDQVQHEVMHHAQPDSTLAVLSQQARNAFAEYGLAQYYPNKIGHFVGLAPDDPGDPDTRLEKGMVITIEPGLYIPAEGLGLRVEDMVIIE
jgi:Xaa-Pro aminopeptidase